MRTIRWPIAILITVAVAIGYLNRQTLALTTKPIEHDIPLSDNDFGNLQLLFYFAYALILLTIRNIRPIALESVGNAAADVETLERPGGR